MTMELKHIFLKETFLQNIWKEKELITKGFAERCQVCLEEDQTNLWWHHCLFLKMVKH